MRESTFTHISCKRIIEIAKAAKRCLIYAAPSISSEVAATFTSLKLTRKELSFRVIVDPDPESLRLGFGEFNGLKILAGLKVELRKAPGLRIGILVADEKAWVFSPTPEIIFDQPSEEINNALCISKDFVDQILVSIAPELSTREELVETAVIADSNEPEIGREIVSIEEVKAIEENIRQAPPQKFDAARRIRVYQSYLQFVDIHFEKGNLRAHRIPVPDDLLRLVDDADVRRRMRASYRLIDANSVVASELDGIRLAVEMLREDFTISVGDRLGRVLRKSAKDEFNSRANEVTATIDIAKQDLLSRLKEEVHTNCRKLADVLAPDIVTNPPTGFQYALGSRSTDALEVSKFLVRRLMPSDATLTKLVEEMELQVVFKDLTYEMLSDNKLVERLKECFPDLANIHEEASALGERE